MPVLIPTRNWKSAPLTIPGLGVVRHPGKDSNGKTVPLITSDAIADYLVKKNLAQIVIEIDSVQELKSVPDIAVLNFFNTSELEEIITIKGIGTRKAEEVIQSRPLTMDKLKALISDRIFDSVKTTLEI